VSSSKFEFLSGSLRGVYFRKSVAGSFYFSVGRRFLIHVICFTTVGVIVVRISARVCRRFDFPHGRVHVIARHA